MCVLMLPAMPRAVEVAIYASSYCCIFVVILLYICPHAAMCVSSCYRLCCAPLGWASCYICVLILLYMCCDTAIYVSAYCYICVLMLLYMCSHAAIYVSACCYMRVLMLPAMPRAVEVVLSTLDLTYADVC
jgi:hypothetical protein